MNSFNTELPLKDVESAIKNESIDLFTELKDLKFVTTLILEFKKIQSNDITLYSTFNSNSKAETRVMNESIH